MRRILTFVAACIALGACSEEGVSVDTANLSDEARACLYGANAMIDLAREAVADTSSRPQRREARRVLMEGWVERLEAGEDPCAVYGDIQLSSTTF